MHLSSSLIRNFQNEIEEIGKIYFGNATKLFIDDFEKNKNRYHLFIFIKENVVAGFLILSIICDEGEILQIAVKDVFSGRGIGQSLVKEAVDFSIENNIKKIFLEVRESNEKAKKMYFSAGFEEIGLRKSYYDNPAENALLMSRKCCVNQI